MTSAEPLCRSPFYLESLFPATGGFIEGRYCETFGNISCCLPCPLADWRYGDNTAQKAAVAGWISVAILPLCVFLLISYAVLAPQMDQSSLFEYLLYSGYLLHGDQCYNAITPNDMYTDLSCAFSGALLLFGGWMVVIWSFLRTIAFHLQVCWEVVLGPKFMWGAFLCGFGVPAIGITVMLIITGVSFRFGQICHINIKHGEQDYWYPIMAFAAAALVMQLATMAYCIHIYLRSLFDKSGSTTENSSGLPTYTSSIRTQTARQAYRRVKRVLQLQWRGVALVVIIIANVIFFAVVFIDLDREIAPTVANMERAEPWLGCLLMGGTKKECMKYASELGPNEATILAMIYLLSLVGIWNFVLFARPSMFAGWLDLWRRGFKSRHEYVSADASNRHVDNKGFEMLTTNSVKTPDPYMRSPSPTQMMGQGRTSMTSPSPTFDQTVHFGQEARYVRPSMSFSGPRPPSASGWDPSSTFAHGHVR
ncbi:uncharacterized protein N7477_007838 [Penicillium maclennaniae]|uniref:uncharacterized protein n=1 Tax=Penicillium maclennaniae TaxID=1343394 RepID=UPI00254252E9|nr:uncharacterized protein N7477_007838 [Penicillium maclennaniae]KAJ5665390.1 hypothetical protein N7477_007838 [Penicillium maclennaniae]